jgi:hypothetical protein
VPGSESVSDSSLGHVYGKGPFSWPEIANKHLIVERIGRGNCGRVAQERAFLQGVCKKAPR